MHLPEQLNDGQRSSPQGEALMQDPLAEKLLLLLKARPGLTASELAEAADVDRSEVNRCLAHALAGKVQQDQAYPWRLRDHSAVAGASTTSGTTNPPSELARLCRYYLECIGPDSELGVSLTVLMKSGHYADFFKHEVSLDEGSAGV